MKRISSVVATLLFCLNAIAQTEIAGPGERGLPLPFKKSDEQRRAVIEHGSVGLDYREINDLLSARIGSRVKLPSVDRFTGNQTEPLEFERVALFAPGARVYAIGESETVIIKLRPRHFFLASNSSTAIGLAVDPETGITSGYAIKGGIELEVSGELQGSLEFVEIEAFESGSKECGTVLDDQPVESIAFLDDGIPASLSAATAGSTLDFEAVVAIETDTEWLAGFNNDTSAAGDWILNLFLALNVMFERDVATRLLLGDVFLRTGSDPYTNTSGNRSQQLDEFGEYWRLNQGGVDRDFAAMLSGRNIGNWSFSGIAWLNQYCQ